MHTITSFPSYLLRTSFGERGGKIQPNLHFGRRGGHESVQILNAQSGVTGLTICVNGQWSNTYCSVCICPHLHRRLSLSVLAHLPVSIFKKWDPRRILLNSTRSASGTAGSAYNRMTGQIRIKQKVIFSSGRVRLTDPTLRKILTRKIRVFLHCHRVV